MTQEVSKEAARTAVDIAKEPAPHIVDARPTPASVLASIPARDFFAAFGLAFMLYVIAAAVSAVMP